MTAVAVASAVLISAPDRRPAIRGNFLLYSRAKFDGAELYAATALGAPPGAYAKL